MASFFLRFGRTRGVAKRHRGKMIFDDSEISEFKTEALELLSSAEQSLLQFESTGDFEKTRSYGAFDLLDKPFKIDEILKKCDHARIYGKEYVASARNRGQRYKKTA